MFRLTATSLMGSYTKPSGRSKYAKEMAMSTYIKSEIAQNTKKSISRYVSAPIHKSKAMQRKFGKLPSAYGATFKSDYHAWFKETYGIDLSTDEGAVLGCPSLSNSATITQTHGAAMDEASVSKTRDYPAEELDAEIRRAAHARYMKLE